MATAVEDLLRLAWQANADGRAGLRDALMTLAVADSGGENLALAERCRRVLVARQPDHWYASSDSLGHALSRPKVVASLAKLRTIFPPARVRHLLLRGDAGRGPYQGRTPALSEFLGELAPGRCTGPAGATPRQARRIRRIRTRPGATSPRRTDRSWSSTSPCCSQWPSCSPWCSSPPAMTVRPPERPSQKEKDRGQRKEGKGQRKEGERTDGQAKVGSFLVFPPPSFLCTLASVLPAVESTQGEAL